MRHLRNYIRQILLESSMNPKIQSQYDRLKKEGMLVTLKGSDLNADVGLLNVGKKSWDANMGHVTSYWKSKGSAPGPCNNAAIIGGTGMGYGAYVRGGFGPLLYDILFEVVMLYGFDGIGPDVSDVSDEAYRVWEYYLNSRPDVVTKQRDITQHPRTKPLEDDCTENQGFSASAGHFPGGRERAYVNPVTIKIGDEDVIESHDSELTPEFIDYWFDPGNPMSKTYHKVNKGTPIINQLRRDLLLHPESALHLGKPYSPEEVKSVWEYAVYYNSSSGWKDPWVKNYGLKLEEPS